MRSGKIKWKELSLDVPLDVPGELVLVLSAMVAGLLRILLQF